MLKLDVESTYRTFFMAVLTDESIAKRQVAQMKKSQSIPQPLGTVPYNV